MDRQKFKRALAQGRFEWRIHTLERLVQRDIAQEEVLHVLKRGEQIAEYPDDTPYPSALFFGFSQDRPLHAVAAFDEANNWVYIITAYIPDLEHFEADYKTRREG